MAVTAEAKLDARKLRADFPIFEQEIHGKPLAYLDSAASSQKPRYVLDRVELAPVRESLAAALEARIPQA